MATNNTYQQKPVVFSPKVKARQAAADWVSTSLPREHIKVLLAAA